MDSQIWFDTSLFLYSIVLGFFFGLFYELFRFFRLAVPHCSFAVAVEDFVFFLPVTIIFLMFTYAFSEGEIRWFSVGGMGMGFFLYFQTLGKLLLFFSNTILYLVKSLLCFMFRVTVIPLWNVFKKITKYLYTKIISFGIIVKEKRIRRRLKKQKNRVMRAARQGFGY
ncbi:MAG: spore cortex biosynthesis protein YabQ [Clostridia bacterium]|nr:spore cortex biosynthesis protein YabQ [Clostridia bacterium]